MVIILIFFNGRPIIDLLLGAFCMQIWGKQTPASVIRGTLKGMKLNSLCWIRIKDIKGTSNQPSKAGFPCVIAHLEARWDTFWSTHGRFRHSSFAESGATPGSLFETAMEVEIAKSFSRLLSHSHSCFRYSILVIKYGNRNFTSNFCQETWSFNCISQDHYPIKIHISHDFPTIFPWILPMSHHPSLCAAPCRLAQRKAVLAAASGAKAKPRRSASSLGNNNKRMIELPFGKLT